MWVWEDPNKGMLTLRWAGKSLTVKYTTVDIQTQNDVVLNFSGSNWT